MTAELGRGTKVFDAPLVRGKWRMISTADDVLELMDSGAEGVVAGVADERATFLGPIHDELQAVVCLSGTPRSSMAIVSREYQVPCVMGAAFTTAPADGDIVEVDCSDEDGVVRDAAVLAGGYRAEVMDALADFDVVVRAAAYALDERDISYCEDDAEWTCAVEGYRLVTSVLCSPDMGLSAYSVSMLRTLFAEVDPALSTLDGTAIAGAQSALVEENWIFVASGFAEALAEAGCDVALHDYSESALRLAVAVDELECWVQDVDDRGNMAAALSMCSLAESEDRVAETRTDDDIFVSGMALVLQQDPSVLLSYCEELGVAAGSIYSLLDRADASRLWEFATDGRASARSTSAHPPAAPLEPASASRRSSDALLHELDSLIGLSKVKAMVRELTDVLWADGMRRKLGLPPVQVNHHLAFSGPPGTGKTTVARILADIYRDLGILDHGMLIETSRADLCGGFVGQTALKTRAVLESALGGVLFIDEAHSLTRSDFGNDYGSEAIDELLKFMEDRRGELVVIAAGYEDEMERFLESNPGLRSRFSRVIHFEDYTDDELVEIFLGMCAGGDFGLDSRALHALQPAIRALRGEKFANGRTVRDFYERCVRRQATRLRGLGEPTRESLRELSAEDLVSG